MNSKILQKWENAWTEASFLWSKFLKLGKPIFCLTQDDEKREGLSSSFAMIRLTDQKIIISLRKIKKEKLESYPLEILAHEIGHHIYCPGDLTDLARMIARIRVALPGFEFHAPFICNLYSDLLINDKLKREFNLSIDKIYEIISKDSVDPLWTFYMRIYEILWGIQRGTLAKGEISDSMEGDAQLGNRIVRNFSREWIRGSGRFAALCYPYLIVDNGNSTKEIIKIWLDSESNNDCEDFPSGLSEMDDGEFEDSIHPVYNNTEKKSSGSTGQARQPFEFGEILKAIGIKMSNEEMMYRYYKELASPHLIPFPQKKIPQSKEPILEGTDVWDIGSPIENIDWFQTAMKSTIVIPGFTTVEQIYGFDVGTEAKIEPVDLDIYIDCSGSMPVPSMELSYLALCASIITLSALRTGSNVQATLWSGKNQFKTTNGFINDEKEIFKIITGFIGGATAFPIHILRETYQNRKINARKVHILQISDDGITTMFDKDEKGNKGFDISRIALEKAGAGGTFVLNLWGEYNKIPQLLEAEKQGWEIHKVTDWSQLIQFAKSFSQKNYGKDS